MMKRRLSVTIRACSWHNGNELTYRRLPILRCEAAYRQALLELEANDNIEVLSKDERT
jgi:hypothetical protein